MDLGDDRCVTEFLGVEAQSSFFLSFRVPSSRSPPKLHKNDLPAYIPARGLHILFIHLPETPCHVRLSISQLANGMKEILSLNNY